MKPRNEVKKDVIEHAMKDEKYKAQLLANPRPLVETATGAKLPPNFKIDVVQETANSMTIVLPVSTTAKRQLSDADLDAVTGGSHAWRDA